MSNPNWEDEARKLCRAWAAAYNATPAELRVIARHLQAAYDKGREDAVVSHSCSENCCGVRTNE